MKKEKIFSIGILLLGLIFELLYWQTDATFLNVKLYILGIICVLIGAIGCWIYVILPFFSKK